MSSATPAATPPDVDRLTLSDEGIKVWSMLPALRIVTGSETRVPKVDLARVIRLVCEGAWQEGSGPPERLYLCLQPLVLSLDRVGLLAEALGALLRGGLSPGFSLRTGAVGVHLWSPHAHRQDGTMLIADDGTALCGEPSTPSVTIARRHVEQAGCHLIWELARGVVWRIHIPADQVEDADRNGMTESNPPSLSI